MRRINAALFFSAIAIAATACTEPPTGPTRETIDLLQTPVVQPAPGAQTFAGDEAVPAPTQSRPSSRR